METSSDYINHVNIVKELNLYTTIRENQKPYEKRFEEIYQKVKDADVNLSSAKDFLHNLSESEMGTLQKFEGLADSINIDSLTNEGAYNLLVHTYEKYDWNNDGITQIGAAKVLMSIPKNMDDETKKAWVKTLNAMGDDFMATSVITLSLNDEYSKRQMAEHFSKMSESERATMQESASFDINQFIEATLSKPYSPKLISFLDILEKVDSILSSSDGGYSSPEMMASTQRLKEELTKAYAEVQNETKERLTTQQEIEIKQQAAQTISEIEESPLAIAIKESSEIQSVEQTQATGRMAQMEEKYKDVYTPMPEKFSQKIEDLQTALIRERYPDYLPMDEVLKKYAVAIENASPEAREKAKTLQDAKIAESLKTEGPNHYNGGLPRDEEREAFIRSVMKQHPNNIQDKYFDLSNSPQRARTLNAAVYEGLEKGESLDDAYAKAGQVMNTYIDNSEMFQKMFDGSRKFFAAQYAEFERIAEEGKERMRKDGILQIQKEDNSIKYDGTVLDLRKYGFDREISTLVLSKSNKSMVASLQEQIKFFDFILKNQELVKGKYDELDEKYKQRNSFNDTVITPVQESFPIAQRALEVFSQYKIYDN